MFLTYSTRGQKVTGKPTYLLLTSKVDVVSNARLSSDCPITALVSGIVKCNCGNNCGVIETEILEKIPHHVRDTQRHSFSYFASAMGMVGQDITDNVLMLVLALDTGHLIFTGILTWVIHGDFT